MSAHPPHLPAQPLPTSPSQTTTASPNRRPLDDPHAPSPFRYPRWQISHRKIRCGLTTPQALSLAGGCCEQSPNNHTHTQRVGQWCDARVDGDALYHSVENKDELFLCTSVQSIPLCQIRDVVHTAAGWITRNTASSARRSWWHACLQCNSTIESFLHGTANPQPRRTMLDDANDE